MEQTAIILIVLTLFLLLIIVGILTFLLFKILKERSNPNLTTGPRSELHPSILQRIKQAEEFSPKNLDLFCPIHTEEPGETTCAICDQLFCKSCVRPFKTLHLCKEHLPLLMQQEWDEILTLKTSTSDPEQGVKLYDFKKVMFSREGIPTYIETHYKINVDQDYIETYLVLYGTLPDAPKLKELLTTHLSSLTN